MRETAIDSAVNARFKRWKRLAHETRMVKKERASLIEGIHLVEVVRDADTDVMAVIVDAERVTEEALALARQTCEIKHAHLFFMASGLYNELSPVEHGVGVMAEIALPDPLEAIPEGTDVLYLDGVQDAGNAGTLIRTAVAAGIKTIVASPTTALLWTPKVLRAGMGAHFGATIIENIDAQSLREGFAGRILAADARGGEDLFAAGDYTGGAVAWIMGAEGPGVSAEALAVTDQRFYIPISKDCESLNVGAAAAVCLFDTVRRRAAH